MPIEDGHHHLAVELTREQAMRAHKGHAIQIQPHQMGKGHLFVHHENHERIARAVHHGRGVRVHLGPAELMHTAHHHIIHGMDGSGFWSKLWHGIKKGYNWLKDTGILSAAADAGTQALQGAFPEASPVIGVARQEIKKRAGFGVRRGKKEVRFARHNALVARGLYLS